MTLDCPYCGEPCRFHPNATEDPIGEDNTTILECDNDLCPIDRVVVRWIVDEVVANFVREAYEMEN